MLREPPKTLVECFEAFAWCSLMFCLGSGLLRLAVFVLFSEWQH